MSLPLAAERGRDPQFKMWRLGVAAEGARSPLAATKRRNSTGQPLDLSCFARATRAMRAGEGLRPSITATCPTRAGGATTTRRQHNSTARAPLPDTVTSSNGEISESRDPATHPAKRAERGGAGRSRRGSRHTTRGRGPGRHRRPDATRACPKAGYNRCACKNGGSGYSPRKRAYLLRILQHRCALEHKGK